MTGASGSAAEGVGARLRAWLRQRGHPAEIRIAAPVVPSDLERRVTALLDERDRSGPGEPDGARNGTAPDDGHDEYLADVATSLWRARRKLDSDGSDGLRSARRHLDSSWRALEDAGVTVQEHDRKPFDAGQALEAVAMQPAPELTRETVIETVRPTVYVKGRHVQMGQVIVGQPDEVGQ